MQPGKMQSASNITPVAVRRMRAADIPQVVAIEQEAFSPGWVGASFRRDLNNRYCRYLVAHFLYSAPDADADFNVAAAIAANADVDATADDLTPAIPADASMWQRMVSGVKSALGLGAPDDLDDTEDPDATPDIAGYVGVWFQGDQAHITEIAVRESLRGQGIGELLLIGTLRAAYEQGMDAVTLEARVSNFIAQRLYEKYGFNSVGTRKNYYVDNKEDAVIMTTDPIHTAAYRRQFYNLEQRFQQRYGPIRIAE